jgi:hypothetical protein
MIASWGRNIKYTLPVSLHYGTLEVFTSHVKSSEAELPAAISYRQLNSNPQLPRTPNSSIHNSLRTCSILVLVLSTANYSNPQLTANSEFASLISTLHTPRGKTSSAVLLRYVTGSSLGPPAAAKQRDINTRRTVAQPCVDPIRHNTMYWVYYFTNSREGRYNWLLYLS